VKTKIKLLLKFIKKSVTIFFVSLLVLHTTNTFAQPQQVPDTNHIYLPNGGHSCISKIEFTPKEPLFLRSGWTWLSFPRLERIPNNPTPPTVLAQNRISGTAYTSLEMQHKKIDNYGNEVMTSVTWDYSGWQNDGLTEVDSKFGYKLYLEPTEPRTIDMLGTVLDPTTFIDIKTGPNDPENWVGYFLPEKQSPFDAIPDIVLDELTQIKGQDWCCVKVWQNQQARWLCAVHQSDVEVNYGDMLILKTNSDLSFQWQRYGNSSDFKEKLATEYFQFNEQADYTSFFIELDSTANPQEIGAFIGDSCIGASTVLVSDTNVLVPGYIEGMSGDVTFEEYYDSLKSHKPAIKEYFVNNKNGNFEKRTINTSEKQDYYIISFKNKKIISNEILNDPAWISCSPNPIKASSLLNYYIPEQSLIRISLYNLYGRELNVLYDGISKSGDFNIQWNATSSNGQKLANGVYLIKLKVGKYQAQTKIIVMK